MADIYGAANRAKYNDLLTRVPADPTFTVPGMAPGGVTGAATASASAERGPRPSQGSPDPYAAGVDPTYDAWQSQYNYRRATNTTDADNRRRQNQDSYSAALADLELQGRASRRNLESNMLARGVFRSGETARRGAELDAALLTARGAADASLAGNEGQITSDLERALTSLDLERESQIAAAKLRQDAVSAAAAAPPAASVAGDGAAAAAVPVTGSRNGLPPSPVVSSTGAKRDPKKLKNPTLAPRKKPTVIDYTDIFGIN